MKRVTVINKPKVWKIFQLIIEFYKLFISYFSPFSCNGELFTTKWSKHCRTLSRLSTFLFSCFWGKCTYCAFKFGTFSLFLIMCLSLLHQFYVCVSILFFYLVSSLICVKKLWKLWEDADFFVHQTETDGDILRCFLQSQTNRFIYGDWMKCECHSEPESLHYVYPAGFRCPSALWCSSLSSCEHSESVYESQIESLKPFRRREEKSQVVTVSESELKQPIQMFL